LASLLTAVPACAQATRDASRVAKPPDVTVDGAALNITRPDPFTASQLILRDFQPTMEKGSYLGLTASPVPPVVRAQLRLRPGLGLVVDFVRPDSPAAAAGLKANDILEKFDDQLLVSMQQLAILVRMHKPGDAIKLSIIREAQPQALSATLAEGDVPPLEELSGGDSSRRMYDVITKIHPYQNTLKPPGGRDAGGANSDVFEARWTPARNATYGLVWSDKEHTFEFTQDKERHLVAKDKSGKTIFDGPIATDEQVEKLPVEIREKVKKVKVMRLDPPPATTSPAMRTKLAPLPRGGA
jgi:membrane-associated protease RseP (regulator of RpoE activity)